MALDPEEKKRLRRAFSHARSVREQIFDPRYREASKYCRSVRQDWSEEDAELSGGSVGADPDVLDTRGEENCNIASQGITGWTMGSSIRWWRMMNRSRKMEQRKRVRTYYQDCEDHLSSQFARGNFYSAFAEGFKDFIGFGQITIWEGENADADGISCLPLHIKRVTLLQNDLAEIIGTAFDSFMTADEILERWPESTRGNAELEQSKRETPETRYAVHHLVIRRPNGTIFAPKLKKPWASYYFLEGISANSDDEWFDLDEGGFDSNPYLTARWDTVNELAYGVGPGVYATPKLKMLQQMRKIRIQAGQVMAQPPFAADKALRGRVNYYPRGGTWLDKNEKKPEPLFTGTSVPALDKDIAEMVQSIDEIFFRDLFMMLLTSPREMTALEVGERQGERAALLGPPLQRLQAELLQPAIWRAWLIETSAGRLPPPPSELRDEEIYFDFLGLLAQMQKRHARVTNTMQALSGIQAVAAIFGKASLDNYDDDIISTRLTDTLGLDQDAVKDEVLVRKTRENRAAAVQAQQQAAQNLEYAKTFLPNVGKLNSITPQAPGMGGG